MYILKLPDYATIMEQLEKAQNDGLPPRFFAEIKQQIAKRGANQELDAEGVVAIFHQALEQVVVETMTKSYLHLVPLMMGYLASLLCCLVGSDQNVLPRADTFNHPFLSR